VLNVTSTLVGPTDSISVCVQDLPFTWNGTPYNTAGTYTKTLISRSGCDSLATLVLTVRPLATATLSGPSGLCLGDSTTINLALTGTPPWTVVYTDGTNNYTINNITSSPYQFMVAPKKTTTYSLVSVEELKCTNVNPNSSVTVTVFNTVNGTRYPDVIARPNVPKQLQARNLGNNYKYLWSPGTGLNFTNIINPVFRHTASVDYQISITTNNGCKVVDSLLVKVEDTIISDLYVPKAWTPNNDGHNDKLTPLLVNIKELHYFIIYNRWGQKMFETHVKYEGWDGIWKGVPQVQDVYTWVVEGLGEDGVIHKKSGNSVLLR
jgi:gliding motility-associated-like protein